MIAGIVKPELIVMLTEEIRPPVIVATPKKVSPLFTASGGLRDQD
jgi:hypothetical protein